MTLKVIDYFASEDRGHWLDEIARCEWGGGQFLHSLLSEGTFFDAVGERSRLLLLVEGDELISFCTYAEKDDIQPTELTPWIGFVYTFEKHRGKRCVGRLFEHIDSIAESEGVDKVYISTNHTGLYEKYGCEYFGELTDIHGKPSRIYVKKIKRIKESNAMSKPKVLLINGSPRANGCTATALEEMINTFREEGVETELVNIGAADIRGCIACNKCFELGRCVFDDLVNRIVPLFEQADGLVVGSPVYYSSPNGSLISLLDRLFHSARFPKHFKVGAAVVSCRRGGNTASFDVLNKYFSISSMPIASSTYWNQVHGFTAEDVKKDAEGLQTMRNLARNMAFMIKAFADAKEKYGLPILERGAFTSFGDGK